MILRLRPTLPLVLFGLSACPGRDAEDSCAAAQTEVEIGTGEEAFVPLAESDPLPFVFGPQGGYHVYGSLRARGLGQGDPTFPFDPNNPRLTFEVFVDGARVAEFIEQPRVLVDAGDGWSVVVGERVVFTTADPLSLSGAAAVFSAQAYDRCGRQGEDSRAVVLQYAAE